MKATAIGNGIQEKSGRALHASRGGAFSLSSRPLCAARSGQSGAALLAFLLVLIVATSYVFLGRLNSAAQSSYRDQRTADALAQAKEALLGRAVKDNSLPGSLPCPDLVTNIPGNNVPNDGVADLLVGNDCPSYIGRLPWRTLGLPDLRDGSGERLWYALSRNYRDDNSAQPLNSDTPGQLNIDGVNDVVAVVIAPGDRLPAQARPSSNAGDYLEGENSNGDTNYASGPESDTFNDRLIKIGRQELMAGVETRIAREAKLCLDNYAASSNGKYPFAFPVASPPAACTDYTFGRVAPSPLTVYRSVHTNLSSVATLQTDMGLLQSAITQYSSTPNSVTRNNLKSVADTTKTASDNAESVIGKVVADQAKNAADLAKNLTDNLPPIPVDVTAAQTALSAAVAAVAAIACTTTPDAAMANNWPAGCVFSSGYWNSWSNLVFYQVADGFKPGSAPACGATCLTINGAGSYRAVAGVAGRQLAGQDRTVNQDPPANYLEGINPPPNTNAHSGTSPLKTFETYRRSDPNYAQVNDLMVCMDGGNTCK